MSAQVLMITAPYCEKFNFFKYLFDWKKLQRLFGLNADTDINKYNIFSKDLSMWEEHIRILSVYWQSNKY